MIRKIKKRDGKIVDFNPVKITEAIWKAAQAVGGKDYKRAGELTNKVIDILEKELKRSEIPTVEQVQDAVEKVLIEDGHAKTAKAYILYRKQHQDLREIGGLLKDIDVVDDYLSMLDWKVNENSNMAYSLQGLNVYATESIISHYWLNKIYPPEIGEAHTKGDYHLHDLGTLGPYCVGWDLKDLLLLGFKGVSGKIESKPAKHFSTALMQIVNYLYTLQGEAAGAQALSNFDTLLAPFVAKDQLQYENVKQEMQKFLFNMNVPTRVGFQSPFSNCTMDLTIPGYLAEEPAIIGGNLTDNNYSDFTKEMEMINRAFAENMYEGDSKGRPFTFPIPTVNITKDFKWDNEELDSLWDMTAKYGIPYFSNFINSDMNPEDARSMCPLAGDEKVLIKSSRGRGVEYSMIRNIYEGNSNQEEYEIYSAGKFIKGKFNKWNDQQMLKIRLENGHEIKMSAHHLNYIMNNSTDKKENVVKARDLKSGMYLPYSLQQYEGSGGTKDLGYFVGAYAGDGSFDGDTTVVFSLENHFKKGVITTLTKIAEQYFGAHCTVTADKKTKLTTVKVHSKAAVGLCKDYVEGIQKQKKYTARVFATSKDFRKGVINGHYDTDGGNRNRIYTSSPPMIETLNMLSATLGTTTSIYEDSRSGRLGTEPNYSVLIYQLNRKNYGDLWFKKNNKLWVRIKEITSISNSAAYCFEVKDGTPLFTVGTTGILTHNCRLRLDNRELRKRGGGLFGANPKTGCYDEKTEVLTENGWRFFKDVNKNEKVFTLTEHNEIELHKPARVFEYDYDSEMYHFKTRSFDLLVTPNHRMVVDNTWTKERKFIEAKDFVPNTHRIPKQGIWNCEKKKYFELPSVLILSGSGPASRFSDEELEVIKVAKREGKSIYQLAEKFNCDPVTIYNIYTNSMYGNKERVRVRHEAPPLKIQMDDWLKFFGFWLAEGCTDNEKIAKNHGYRVVISQINKQKRKEIRRVLDSLPFNYMAEGETNFVICNKQLWMYLKQFGNAYTKFIPRVIKELERKKLKILFDWMIKGDGHERKSTGQINYWTSSKKLADDVQEVALKQGWLATIRAENNNISDIKGRKITSRTIYTIGVHRKSRHFRLRETSIHKEQYKGKVFCLEVPNHTLYVRRNGKPCWCGNSIGVVTLNMPRIGYLAKDDSDFFERLDKIMVLAKNSLEIKRDLIENLTYSGLHPYSRFYLSDVKKTLEEYWKNHFSTIGLIGMNDALLNFMNKSIGDKEGKTFAEKVLDYMRTRIADFQVETGNIFNLEATPGEGTSYRLARIDKKEYPDLRTYNQEMYTQNRGRDVEPYYTNSTQLPVGFTTDVFEALDLQDSLQTKYTGGTVLHIFLGEEEPSPTATKNLVRKVAENYALPYYTITPTFSVCPDHGYIAGQHQFCPTCEAQKKTTECEVYSRVVGYIRPVNQWNKGKQQEFRDRKTFDLKEKILVSQ